MSPSRRVKAYGRKACKPCFDPSRPDTFQEQASTHAHRAFTRPMPDMDQGSARAKASLEAVPYLRQARNPDPYLALAE